MVRFDEIREIMRTNKEPLDACKALTERANQAGGHDNITVIIVQFDGEGLRATSADCEPLRYRKYPLPEENDATQPTRRHSVTPSTAENAPAGSANPGADGLASIETSGAPPPGTNAATWHERGPHPLEPEERIDIPGTHVPTWVVVALILGVMAILGATAFLFLR